jgi:hypothetical protein
MESAPQRATIVLEHVSASTDCDGEDYDDSKAWSVVAYLITDSGARLRVTLYSCKTRSDASTALRKIWSSFTERSSFTATAA